MPHKRRKARRQIRRSKGTNDNENGRRKGGKNKSIKDDVDKVIEDGGEIAIQNGGEIVIQDGGEIVIQDGGEIAIQDEGINAVDRVPPEIWTRILSLLDFYPHSKFIDKRLVCRVWRDVIDELMFFRVFLNDQKIDVGSTMSHIQAKSCVVACLLNPVLPEQLILRYPEKLEELLLWGPISLNNMVYFARRFVKVNKLHLNGKSFVYGGNENFLIPAGDEDLAVLTKWLGRLEQLELSGIRLRLPEPLYNHQSYKILFTREMPMLKSLCVELDVSSSNYNSSVGEVIMFIARNPGIKLVSLQIRSDEHHNINVEFDRYYPRIRLETLLLNLYCPVEFRWFLPLIQQQKTLKELRVRFFRSHCTSLEPPGGLRCMEWSKILESIAKTIRLKNLESLQIYQFYIQNNLNMAPFRCQRNLKKLVLIKSNMEPNIRSEVINLAQLPDSLEYLKLTNLTCKTYDLELLLDYTPKLKCLELNPAGRDGGFGVYPNGLRRLMRKTTMKTFSLKHINWRRFDVQTINGKPYIILDEFQIHVKHFCSHHHDCCFIDVEFDKLA